MCPFHSGFYFSILYTPSHAIWLGFCWLWCVSVALLSVSFYCVNVSETGRRWSWWWHGGFGFGETEMKWKWNHVHVTLFLAFVCGRVKYCWLLYYFRYCCIGYDNGGVLLVFCELVGGGDFSVLVWRLSHVASQFNLYNTRIDVSAPPDSL